MRTLRSWQPAPCARPKHPGLASRISATPQSRQESVFNCCFRISQRASLASAGNTGPICLEITQQKRRLQPPPQVVFLGSPNAMQGPDLPHRGEALGAFCGFCRVFSVDYHVAGTQRWAVTMGQAGWKWGQWTSCLPPGLLRKASVSPLSL